MASDQARTTIGAVVGRNLRAYRESQSPPMTQDDLARRVREVGLDNWSRAIVANVEAGERQVLLDELVMLSLATGWLPVRFLDGDDAVIARGAGQVAGGGGVPLPLIRDLLAGGERGETMMRSHSDYLQRRRQTPLVTRCAELEAEQKAARRLNVSPLQVAEASISLWGRCLTDERDHRVAAALSPSTPPRTAQALRGHITRELLAELAPAIGSQP